MAFSHIFLFILVILTGSIICSPLINEWKLIKHPSSNEIVKVTIALKQTNRQWLESTLYAVSDPSSAQYGHHLTLNEIVQHVHGHPEGVKATMSFFNSRGLEIDFTLGQGFAVIEMDVQTAEDIFATKFYTYQHRQRRDTFCTCSPTYDYTIPSSIEPHVEFISGITCGKFSRELSPRKRVRRYGNDTIGDVTPAFIDKSYNINGYSGTSDKNSQAVAGFLGQYFSPDDLQSFQKTYKLPKNPIFKVVGKNDENDQGIEADLDVEYITGIGKNIPTWFISVTSRANHRQEDFLDWVLELVNDTETPWVHSVSYGDYESSIDPAFMARVDEEFMKLGTSGRTLLFASGDSGTACSLLKGGVFEPMWPSSSPYVTAVGGTVSMDQAWDHGGGGFSNVYSTPSYQTGAVSAYLKSGSAPNTRYFNSTGRGYPDVSAFSINFLIVYISLPYPVDGTSCATPTTAGVVSLLNDVRLNAGKSTLGFMNPLLYQLGGKGFFDITKGVNNGRAWCKGFQAIQGWDPASGWGSPNFGVLKGLI